ncbi:hypothetical protein [Halosegnis marinus]|uniref:DUF4401 domain-containing protein n=1 Tax=Halosegnis marinus TaxID=3034023 RepID=A0ABD5ZRE8_9EURY|nr:hypothetical protein [Halosegnis sp. DT85]
MNPTRYDYLALLGAALVAVAALVPGVRAVAAFVGGVYLLLAGYATLHGAAPTRAALAAGTTALLVGTLLALSARAGLLALPPVVAAGDTLPAHALSGFALTLALAPLPAAFALAASGRALDRGPYVLAAVAAAVGGPLAAVALARWLGTAVGTAEVAVGTLAAGALLAGGPAYLAFRRRVPGVADAYPSLDDLPLSRPTIVALLWLLVVVSGWGPVRVVSGAVLSRPWGVVPPDSVLAVPFVLLLVAAAYVAVGLRNHPAWPERLFGLAVVGYAVGALAYAALTLADVSVATPRYLGFGATVLVTVLAAVALVRRL